MTAALGYCAQATEVQANASPSRPLLKKVLFMMHLQIVEVQPPSHPEWFIHAAPLDNR
jgi:hypothetical protein